MKTPQGWTVHTDVFDYGFLLRVSIFSPGRSKAFGVSYPKRQGGGPSSYDMHMCRDIVVEQAWRWMGAA